MLVLVIFRLASAGKSVLEVVVSSWGYEYPQMPGVRANVWANAWPGVDTQVQGRSSPRRASCLRSSPRTWVRWYARGRHAALRRDLTAPRRGLTGSKRGELRFTGTYA